MPVCVECGHSVESLYIEFGGAHRLTRCSHCNEYADKYVEYELVIIVLDLILHHPRAYRHVLFNRLRLNDDEPAVILKRVWQLALLVVLMESYINHARVTLYTQSLGDTVVQQLYTVEQIPLRGAFARSAHSPRLDFWVMFAVTVGSFLLYISSAIIAVHIHASRHGLRRPLSMLVVAISLVISSFGKLIFVLMLIWEYSVLSGFVIDAFTISSNILAMQVVLDWSVHAATTAMVLPALLHISVQVLLFVYCEVLLR